MPSRSSVAILYSDIFDQLGIEDDDTLESDGFRLVLDDDVDIRIDFDDEDELIWLTTPLSPIPVEQAERILPRLLRLNLDSAADGCARAIDPGSGAVFVQSRIEGDTLHFADFEAALRRHLEAVEATGRELAAPPAPDDLLPPPGATITWG